MLGRSLLIVLLGLSGCRESATPNVDDATPAADERTKTVEQAEVEHDQPSPPASEPNEPVTEPSPPSKREIVRVRCKRGFTPCNYGRKCCNDLIEVCGKDQRCHPLE